MVEADRKHANKHAKPHPKMREFELSETGSLRLRLRGDMPKSIPHHTPKMLEPERSETGSLWFSAEGNIPNSVPNHTPQDAGA